MNGCRHMTADEQALMRRLIAEGMTAPQAAPQFPGRSSSTLRKSARWRGLRWTPTIPQVRNPYRHPPELREAIRRLWDETDITAREIGEFYGMSKNAIIGMANRGNWRTRQRGGDTRAKTTLADRMAELHAMMDRVLAENPPGTGRLTERVEAAK